MSKNIKENKKSSFLSNMIESLKPMENVTSIVIDDKTFGLCKDDITFGLVIDEEVYFRIRTKLIDANQECISFQNNYYVKISPETQINNDDFLYAATKAYWIASGKS